MTLRRCLVAICLVGALGWLIPAQAVEPACECTPTFREVSEEVMKVEMGDWTLYLGVVLIGCDEDLSRIRDDQMRALQKELQEPREWSNVRLISEHENVELLARVRARVNEILGDQVVSAVLFHYVRRLDHVE